MRTLKQNVLLIHGAGPKHYRSLEDGSGNWQALLPTDLGSRFHVLAPEMPSLTKPVYAEWKVLFEKYLAKVKGDVILVGHSLGGCFLLKYLSEENIQPRVTGLFLVATPHNTVKGFEVLGQYKSLPVIKNITLYHSLDDVEVPYAHAELLKDRLGATLKTYTDQGHYFKRKKFTDLSKDIETISEADLNAEINRSLSH